jgi:hypothetical protein
MKGTRIGFVIGLALLLATSAFAANKASLQIQDSVTVAGTQLNAGDYKLSWEGSGPNVQLNIMKGKNVVATTPARIVELDRTPTNDAAVTNNNQDGARSLTEIRFRGKKQALAIGNPSARVDASEGNK